jgi:D-hydroxyproline dehydrogenase subunit gamma
MDRFRRAVPAATLVDVIVDGKNLRLPEGEMLAAALLASGTLTFSTSINAGEPRGPYCLMGTCFQCAATVDGQPYTRTCRVAVRAGMRVTLTQPELAR